MAMGSFPVAKCDEHLGDLWLPKSPPCVDDLHERWPKRFRGPQTPLMEPDPKMIATQLGCFLPC